MGGRAFGGTLEGPTDWRRRAPDDDDSDPALTLTGPSVWRRDLARFIFKKLYVEREHNTVENEMAIASCYAAVSLPVMMIVLSSSHRYHAGDDVVMTVCFCAPPTTSIQIWPACAQ